MKVYPLKQAANPPATVFVDAKDALFDATIRYYATYFDNLDRVVQAEPWLQRDRAMIDALKSLGMEKGKPFQPDVNRTSERAAMPFEVVSAPFEAKNAY